MIERRRAISDESQGQGGGEGLAKLNSRATPSSAQEIGKAAPQASRAASGPASRAPHVAPRFSLSDAWAWTRCGSRLATVWLRAWRPYGARVVALWRVCGRLSPDSSSASCVCGPACPAAPVVSQPKRRALRPRPATRRPGAESGRLRNGRRCAGRLPRRPRASAGSCPWRRAILRSAHPAPCNSPRRAFSPVTAPRLVLP